jgi:REP element-mobilizing transposase RayT
MPNTYTQLYYHAVFSTKGRFPFINAPLEERLYPYFYGTAKAIGYRLLIGGGMADHVHLLLKSPARLSVSSMLQSAKGDSSKWVHQTFAELSAFEWQVGYAAFSVSASGVLKVEEYIRNQKNHHQKVSFQDELRALLHEHGIKYDERYLWD